MRFPWQKHEPLTNEIVRDEFIACYLQLVPDEKVHEVEDDWIVWEKGDGSTHKLNLHKVMHDVARLEKQSPKARREIYEGFIGAVSQRGDLPDKIDASFLDRVLPSLRLPSYLQHVKQATGALPPHRMLNDDLLVSYVVDFPTMVTHIMAAQAEDLGLEEAELWETAITNLRQLTSRDEFREALQKDEVTAFQCPDGHAAARLLLAIEYLEEGEEWAAIVPDGALLAIMPPLPDNNWNPLREMARNCSSTGFDRPFRVRPGQLQLM